MGHDADQPIEEDTVRRALSGHVDTVSEPELAPPPDVDSLLREIGPVAPAPLDRPAGAALAVAAPVPVVDESPRLDLDLADGPPEMDLEPTAVGAVVLADPQPTPEAVPEETPPSPEQSADELAAREELTLALELYRLAMQDLEAEQVFDRARLLTKVGDMERRLGQVELALCQYAESLTLDPLNLSALFWATEILYDRKEYGQVEELLQQRLSLLTDTAQRVEVLRALVNLWLDDHRDLERARRYLDQILSEQADDQQALESLIEVQHALGDHEEAIRTRWWLASVCSDDPGRQARLLLEAARAAYQHLGDAAYAVDLGEQALRADPKAYDALELVAGLLVQTENWAHLARTYRTMLEVHPDDWVTLDLCEKLAVLYREKLGELEPAAEALERALTLDAANTRIRLMLIETYTDLGNRERALSQCRIVIRDNPEQPVGYQAAYEVFFQLGGADGAWLASGVLDYLGQGDRGQPPTAQARRSEGLLPAKSVLGEAEWDSDLLWPEHDPTLQRLLKLVTEAAIEYRLELLKEEKRLLTLDPTLLVDPNASTTMLSRTMLWAARLLDVPVPLLYVYPSVPGELGVAPAPQLTVLASRTLGSGFSLRELAFLWARHLASLRDEHRLLLYYPTVGDLAQLVTAAFVAGEFAARRADFFDPKVRAMGEALSHGLSEEALSELAQLTAELGLSEAGSRMLRWARGMELVAARVGLLAAGDIRVAAELTARFPVGGQTGPEEQRRDLLAFSLSEEYLELRSRLGVSVEMEE